MAGDGAVGVVVQGETGLVAGRGLLVAQQPVVVPVGLGLGGGGLEGATGLLAQGRGVEALGLVDQVALDGGHLLGGRPAGSRFVAVAITAACSAETSPVASAVWVWGSSSRAVASATCPAAAAPVARVCLASHARCRAGRTLWRPRRCRRGDQPQLDRLQPADRPLGLADQLHVVRGPQCHHVGQAVQDLVDLGQPGVRRVVGVRVQVENRGHRYTVTEQMFEYKNLSGVVHELLFRTRALWGIRGNG